MAQTFIPAAELDFNSYKDSLKTFLRSQTRFQDIDFEGANINVLMDLLAYNAYNQAHYLNQVGSEMFLDTAILRETIVSHAKELNYVPRSRISARTQVDVEVFPVGAPVSVTIPKNYPFKTSTNLSTTHFLTDQAIIIKRNSDNRYIASAVNVYEGQLVKESFTVLATSTDGVSTTYNQRFDLKSPDIDMTSIYVTVKEDAQSVEVPFTRAADLYGLNGDSEVYFLRGYKDNYYEVEFGDGVLGKALSLGNIVTITYRDTTGAEGNGVFTLSKTSPIDGVSVATVTTLARAAGGAERESNDSIKYNAVRHFQAQARAVTEDDYDILIRTNFPEIQEVSVYGGERIAQYGTVIIVLKPYNIDGTVNAATKDRIIEFLKTKNIVPRPIIVDPEYFYVNITGSVFYNLARTNNRDDEISTDVIEALVALNASVLGDFNVNLAQSLITETITEANPYVTGADVRLGMIKRWAPARGLLTTFTYTLDNAIASSSQGEFINSSSFNVYSSIFKMIIDDAVVSVLIQDNGVGLLHLYDVSTSGTKVKIFNPIGTVDYATGKVTMELDVYDYNPYITFTNNMVENSIAVSLNKFISIDTPHIDLTMKNRA